MLSSEGAVPHPRRAGHLVDAIITSPAAEITERELLLGGGVAAARAAAGHGLRVERVIPDWAERRQALRDVGRSIW
ncbi:hypothetical protein ACSRUE_09490 [Sorangium sp. KYC3313]|uniref:hypothetical protein n=1 Tax=Sorangium sp. KYC3313 TaxID=3449740 RepID=UPI003F88DE07